MNKIKNSADSLLMCISEILIGILLLINPIGFTSAIIMILGIAMVILGVISTIGYFRAKPVQASLKNDLAKGLLLIVSGCFCFLKAEWFIVTFPVLTVLYGVMNIILGAGKIQHAVDMIRMKEKYWFIAMIGAALTIIFAVLILTNPFTSSAFLWTFIAVSLIVEAVMDILTFAFEGRV